MPTWAKLLLDAEALLPEIGPAIVLMVTAHETLIAACLRHLAGQTQTAERLWEWMNDRSRRWKSPSVEESYDSILEILSGRSLKDQPELWEAFMNARKARHSFVHEGRALIGGQEISLAEAVALLRKHNAIADWIEPLLAPDGSVATVLEDLDPASAEW